jgi:hypothetical protein
MKTVAYNYTLISGFPSSKLDAVRATETSRQKSACWLHKYYHMIYDPPNLCFSFASETLMFCGFRHAIGPRCSVRKVHIPLA